MGGEWMCCKSIHCSISVCHKKACQKTLEKHALICAAKEALANNSVAVQNAAAPRTIGRSIASSRK
jgi:hypothetical protein